MKKLAKTIQQHQNVLTPTQSQSDFVCRAQTETKAEYPTIVDPESDEKQHDIDFFELPETPQPIDNVKEAMPVQYNVLSPPLTLLQQKCLELQRKNEEQTALIQKFLMEQHHVNLQKTIVAQKINEIAEIAKKTEEMMAMIVMLKNENHQIRTNYNKLQSIHQQTMDEYKDLEIKYIALKAKHNEGDKVQNHSEFDAQDITKWIVGLDEERYSKYGADLLANLKKEGIDGTCLGELDKHDLHRMGITRFKDKRDVFKALQQLINAEKKDENTPSIKKEKECKENEKSIDAEKESSPQTTD